MVVNEDLILEIVRPGTGDPVADGDVGEIVVTRSILHTPGSGLRWATSPPPCPASALRPHQHAHQGMDGSR